MSQKLALALPAGGALNVLGVHLQFFPCKLRQLFFTALGGALPGYAYVAARRILLYFETKSAYFSIINLATFRV